MDGKERRWKMIHENKDIYLMFSTHSIRGKKVEIKVSFAFKSEFLICLFIYFLSCSAALLLSVSVME